MKLAASLACAILLLASGAWSAPIVVSQGNGRNVVSVIQQRNPLVSIDRDLTASNGRTTVTEIVRIGPDPVPVTIRQNGVVNRSRVVQRGRRPSLDLRQDGALNRAITFQSMIP